jgi:hypothetical protein
MAEIERVQRPFWIHQVVEYLVGIGLVSASIQLPEPAVPSLLGLLIIVNAAVAKGGAGAFRLVGRRLHRTLDLVVIGILVFTAVQPWLFVDATGRLLIAAIAFILAFVWFYTDYAEHRTRAERRADRQAEKAARGPRDSTEIGRRAGRYVGGTVKSVKRWSDGPGEPGPADDVPRPTTWDPPTPPTPSP